MSAWLKPCRAYIVWLLQGNASGNVDPQKDDPAAAAAAAEAAAAVGDYSLLRELLQPVEGPKKTVYEELNRLEATLPPFRVVQP